MKILAVIFFTLGFTVLTHAQDDKRCEDPEYKLLEMEFSDLDGVEKELFFVLDKQCMQELGLSHEDINARRTIFLMGAMNYEGYRQFD